MTAPTEPAVVVDVVAGVPLVRVLRPRQAGDLGAHIIDQLSKTHPNSVHPAVRTV